MEDNKAITITRVELMEAFGQAYCSDENKKKVLDAAVAIELARILFENEKLMVSPAKHPMGCAHCASSGQLTCSTCKWFVCVDCMLKHHENCVGERMQRRNLE